MKTLGSILTIITLSSFILMGVFVSKIEPIYFNVQEGWKCTVKIQPRNVCVRYERYV